MMDQVFRALAHSMRREMLDIVKKDPGCSLLHVCNHFDVSRIAVMKHLKILEEADLIVSRKQGRTRALYINVAPIQMIYDRWTTEYSGYFASRLTDLKYKLEKDSQVEGD